MKLGFFGVENHKKTEKESFETIWLNYTGPYYMSG